MIKTPKFGRAGSHLRDSNTNEPEKDENFFERAVNPDNLTDTAAGIASVAGGFIPGAPGYAISGAADMVTANSRALEQKHGILDKNRKQIAAALDKDEAYVTTRDIDRAAEVSPAFKRKMKKIADEENNALPRFAVTTAGSMGAAAAITAGATLAFGPLGFLGGLAVGAAGALPGGYVSNKAFDFYTSGSKPDAQNIAQNLNQKQVAGQKITPEEVMAALISGMSDRQSAKFERKLGTADVEGEITKLEKGKTSALTKAQKQCDTWLRAYTGVSPANGQTVCEKLAQAINEEGLDASLLIVPPHKVAELQALQHQQQLEEIGQARFPTEVASIGQQMKRQGIGGQDAYAISAKELPGRETEYGLNL